MHPKPHRPTLIHLEDSGVFPNSILPVVYYPHVLDLIPLFKANCVKQQFAKNHWVNAWKGGIFTYDHYHSSTHEVLGCVQGSTDVRLGGPGGVTLHIDAGDVLIIPAGVAHRNMGCEHQLTCIGAYPVGYDFDINTGQPGERPATDERIAQLPIPSYDPLYGFNEGLDLMWGQYINR